MLLFQICAVVGTLALVAIAFALIKTLLRLQTIGNDLAKTAESVRASASRVEGFVTREVQQLANSVQEIVPPLRRVAMRFEDLGERTARISDAVLEEVEAPVRTAVAVMRGVRTGTGQLFRSLARRTAHPKAPMNGGQENA